MYYKILSSEYLEQAQILKRYIKKLKTQFVQINDLEANELSRRISLLYSMYLDLIHTSEYLNRKYEVMKKHE